MLHVLGLGTVHVNVLLLGFRPVPPPICFRSSRSLPTMPLYCFHGFISNHMLVCFCCILLLQLLQWLPILLCKIQKQLKPHSSSDVLHTYLNRSLTCQSLHYSTLASLSHLGMSTSQVRAVPYLSSCIWFFLDVMSNCNGSQTNAIKFMLQSTGNISCWHTSSSLSWMCTLSDPSLHLQVYWLKTSALPVSSSDLLWLWSWCYHRSWELLWWSTSRNGGCCHII